MTYINDGAIYRKGTLRVVISVDDDGKAYYTVINKLYQHIHRHYKYKKQAIMMCKRAGQGWIPLNYSSKGQRDIYYLMNGTEKGFDELRRRQLCSADACDTQGLDAGAGV